MIGIVVLLEMVIVSFALPYIIYDYEDYRLTNYDIHYTVEPVHITTENISLTDKLNEIGNIVDSGSYIYLNSEGGKTYVDSLVMNEKQVKDAAVDAFTKVFWNTLCKGDKKTLYKDEYLAEFTESAEITIEPMLLIRPGLKETFIVWNVDIFNPEMGFISMAIDDKSGSLLAGDISLNNQKKYFTENNSDLDEEVLGNVIADYYGFLYEDTNKISTEEYSSIIDVCLSNNNEVLNMDFGIRKDVSYTVLEIEFNSLTDEKFDSIFEED